MSNSPLKKHSRVISKVEDAAEYLRQEKILFPNGQKDYFTQLKNGDPNAIHTAITFLQTDPIFFRSGYIKEELLRALKKAPLSKKNITALHSLLLDQLQIPARREFRDYCKLAKKIVTDDFINQLQEKTLSTDENVSRQAQWMLDTISE